MGHSSENVRRTDFEMCMSNIRDGGNGDFWQRMDGYLLIDFMFSWRLLFSMSLFESMLFLVYVSIFNNE